MVSRNQAWFFTVMGLIAVAVTALVASQLHREPSTVDAAAIIGITGAAAVGIERIIEIIWTLLGQIYGTWCPMGPPSKRLKNASAEVNETLKAFFEAARKKAGAATALVTEIDNAAADISEQLDAARSSEQLKKVSTDAAAQIDVWHKKFAQGVAGADAAKAALEVVDDFLDTFTSNPLRRIISLFMGMVFGLIVAAFVGLDAIDAALEGSTATVWGMILTGLLIGLGSNPTHEVIKGLQAYKQSKVAALATDGGRRTEGAAGQSTRVKPDDPLSRRL